jgi:WD40 repeat protein
VNTNHGGELEVLDLETGDVIQSWRGHYAWLGQVLLTPDGRYAVGGQWNVPSIWDLKLGREAGKLQGDGMSVTGLALTPDGRHIVMAARGILHGKPLNGVLRLYDLERGEVVYTLGAHTNEVHTLINTPDGMCAISASRDEYSQGKGTIKFWSLDTGKELPNAGREDGDVAVLVMMPDGRWIISGSSYGDGDLEVWDLDSGDTIAGFRAEGGITAGAISADGLTIIAGDDTGAVHLLRVENITPGPPVVTALRPQAGGRRLFRRKVEERLPAFRCPLCGRWAEVDDTSLGSEVSCPSCRTRLRLNPFTIAADWHPVAAAWRGEP